jgi:hypothetical protein
LTSPEYSRIVFEDFWFEKQRPDWSLTLCSQHEAPDGEKRANWTPAPAGPFCMAGRVYDPEASLIDGQYEIPECKRGP